MQLGGCLVSVTSFGFVRQTLRLHASPSISIVTHLFLGHKGKKEKKKNLGRNEKERTVEIRRQNIPQGRGI
jgi:hypothetical protein